jgi:hypothetical protein
METMCAIQAYDPGTYMRLATISFLVLLLGGCATRRSAHEDYQHIAEGNLPATDITLHVPGLTPCTDNPDHSLHLKTGQPVYVLIHGCFGSSGQFRGLAQVLAFHGQQTVCFTYDDRARLAQSAKLLWSCPGFVDSFSSSSSSFFASILPSAV